MSASSEKKRRQAEREQGIVDKRAQAQREAEEQAKKTGMKYRLAMIGIAVFVIFALVLNSALPFTMTAVKVNDKAYSAAEMNYFYSNAFYQYQQYMSMFGVDFNAPLENQECVLAEEGSWKDFLLESASESAKGLEAMYQKAIADGYELSEEGKAIVEENMAYLATYAEENGFKNVKEYLAAAYGTGVTEAIIRDLLTKGNIVSEYSNQVAESFTYTDAELEEYYKANVDNYQTYEYLYYLVAAETESVTDAEGHTHSEVVDGGLEAAKAAADEIAAQVTDADSFEAAVAAYKADATVQTMSGAVKSGVNEAFRDWVTNAARTAGDVTVAESDTGSYVVMYVGMDDNKYSTMSMRHILIKSVDADADGVYSAEEMAIAEEAIKEIETAWLAGEQTEEAFAELAMKYNEDEGSKPVGGLYEGIGKNNMIPEIDSFLFDEARKPGDTVVVHGNNGYYDGYHLVYFVGEGEDYYLTLAKQTMAEEDYAAWQEEVLAGYTVTTGMGYNLIGK